MVYCRLCEKLRGDTGATEEVVWQGGGGVPPLCSRFSFTRSLSLSLFLLSTCRTLSTTGSASCAALSPSRPRVAVGVASKLGQSLVAVASRFGDSKEGSFLFLLIPFSPPSLYLRPSSSFHISFPFSLSLSLSLLSLHANIRVGRAVNRNQTRYVWPPLLDFRVLRVTNGDDPVSHSEGNVSSSADDFSGEGKMEIPWRGGRIETANFTRR